MLVRMIMINASNDNNLFPQHWVNLAPQIPDCLIVDWRAECKAEFER